MTKCPGEGTLFSFFDSVSYHNHRSLNNKPQCDQPLYSYFMTMSIPEEGCYSWCTNKNNVNLTTNSTCSLLHKLVQSSYKNFALFRTLSDNYWIDCTCLLYIDTVMLVSLDGWIVACIAVASCSLQVTVYLK